MITLHKNGEVEVLSTTHSSNITVDIPDLVPEGDDSISLNSALLNFQHEVDELKGNVKWLYLNGGVGGGGGGGGATESAGKFAMLNTGLIDNYIYISEDNINIRYQIESNKSNVKFYHSVAVGTNKPLIKDELILSNTPAVISLKNLTPNSTTQVYFTAYDEEDFVIRYTLNIVSGAVRITSVYPNNSSINQEYGKGDIAIPFIVENKVMGATTVLEVKLNNREDPKVLLTVNNTPTLEHTVFVMKDLNNGLNLEPGLTYKLTAQAVSSLGASQIPSSVYVLNLSLTDSKTVVISTNNISEEEIEDDDPEIKQFPMGGDISFTYSVNSMSYNSFKVAFEILDKNKTVVDRIGYVVPPSDPMWLENRIVNKGANYNFIYPTGILPYNGIYYINIYGWSSDGSIGSGLTTPLTPLKTVKCKVFPTDKRIPPYSTENNTKYTDLDTIINFNSMENKSIYTQNLSVNQNNTIVTNTTNYRLYSTNGITSGFIKSPLTDNITAMRVAGDAYAHVDLDYFNTLTNQFDLWTSSGKGFTLSCTFKTDQHPNANGVVFSYANYNAKGEITGGIEIGLEHVVVKYDDGTDKALEVKLTQNVLTTIDIVFEARPIETVDGLGFIKIYDDGILTQVAEVSNFKKFTFGNLSRGAYFGCKNVNGVLTDFCDVNIYNFRTYRSSLNVPTLTNHFIINYAYLTRDEDGNFDWNEIDKLTRKNFIDQDWNCLLWDYHNNDWRDGQSLYDVITKSPVLPVLLLKDGTNGSTFLDVYNSSYTEAMAGSIGKEKYPCIIEMKDTFDNTVIIPGCSMGLQGTSTMTYASKNLEIYFNEDNEGRERLFTPKPDEWLPENRFTLKADMIDSAHSNNVAIGSFLNQEYLSNNYPKNFAANPYRTKVKHTVEGFPIYLFVKFAAHSIPTFMGIYNFNLGRGSYYNLGFKVIKKYELLNEKGPSLVNMDTFEELVDPYKGGCFSFEFNTNSPTELVAFQQPDRSIVNAVLDLKYSTGTNDNAGWERVYKVVEQISRMYDGSPYKLWEYTNNNFVETNKLSASPERPVMELFTYENNGYFDWDTMCRYFTVAMAFGMVDSLGKNLTWRMWDVSTSNGTTGYGYTSFYDMDTALGLDNFGRENVKSDTYVDYWFNEIKDGYTVANKITEGYPVGYSGGYQMPCSRLWNVVRKLHVKDSEQNVDKNYQTYWCELRSKEGLLRNVDYFMDNFYLKHTKDVGSVIFNADYSIKYLRKYTQATSTGNVTGYNDLGFLHGVRKKYVRQWLSNRLKYLDGVYNLTGLYEEETNKWLKAFQPNNFEDSPYVVNFSGSCSGSPDPIFEFEVLNNTSAIFCMSISQNQQRILLQPNEPTTFKFKGTQASTAFSSWNYLETISKFKGFYQLNFSSIGGVPGLGMKNLLELDLSGMQSIGSTSTDNFNIALMRELRHLNLERFKMSGSIPPRSGFIVDVSHCFKLKTVNITNSHVGTLLLPGDTTETQEIDAGVIESILLSGSLLTKSTIKNQQFITSLDYSDCVNLTSVEITNLPTLETLKFNNCGSLTSIVVNRCGNLKQIICTNQDNLEVFTIDSCESLSTINLSGCQSEMLRINLNGAYNLTSLNLNGFKSKVTPIFPSNDEGSQGLNFYSTLKTLNLTNTNFQTFDFGTYGNHLTFKDEPVLDLSYFTNLTITFTNAIGLKYIKYKNDISQPTALTSNLFSGCTNLTRVFGHLNLSGSSIFNNCNNFYVLEEVNIDGVTPIPSTDFNTDEWATNLTYGRADLNSMFSGTSCTLYDVYYILQKCTTSITSLSSTFANCPKIITNEDNPLNKRMFEKCVNVTSIGSMFLSCGNIRGPILSHTRSGDTVTNYDGLFAPLKKLTNISSLFGEGSGDFYVDDFVFHKIGANEYLQITSLGSVFGSGGGAKFVANTNTADRTLVPARAQYLLRDLPKLQSMTYMFVGIRLDFTTVSERLDETGTTVTTGGEMVSYCPLFKENPLLTTIQNSFTGIIGTGVFRDLFGGHELLLLKYPNSFPKSFSTLQNSFTFASSSNIKFPMLNYMFSRIKKTIKYIGGASIGAVTTAPSISGTITKTYEPEENSNMPFPYKIFDGCSALVDIPAFFYRLDYETKDVIELPRSTENADYDLFKTCTSLENISYMFSNIPKVQFKLAPKGFINCNIKQAAHVFSNNLLNLHGVIPYGLFMMRKISDKSINGWLANNAEGIDEYYGLTPHEVEDIEGNTIIEWRYDETVPDIKPNVNKFSVSELKQTITTLNSCFLGCRSRDAKPYELDLNELNDLTPTINHIILELNPDYNPVKYIPLTVNIEVDKNNPNYNPARVGLNPKYDPVRYKWNPWCVDGNNIKANVVESNLFINGGYTEADLPPQFEDLNNNYRFLNDGVYGAKTTNNYILPPDIFRYCADTTTTNVDYFIADTNQEGGAGDNVYGWYGRIPTDIFLPLTKISNLNYIFKGDKYINPYSWRHFTDDGYVRGEMFPPNLFKYNTSLKSISYIFSNLIIPSDVDIPDTLFEKNTNLESINGLFYTTVFSDSNNPQLPSNLFNNNRKITDISYMIASAPISGGYTGRGPKFIESSLFSSSRHTNLQNISNFMTWCTNTSGTVPEFWKFTNLPNDKFANVFYKIDSNKITNFNDAKSSKYGSAVVASNTTYNPLTDIPTVLLPYDYEVEVEVETISEEKPQDYDYENLPFEW